MAERGGNFVGLFKKYDLCAECPLAERATNGVFRDTDGQRHIPHIIDCSSHKMGPLGLSVLPGRRFQFIFHRENFADNGSRKYRGTSYNLSIVGKCPAEKRKKPQSTSTLVDKTSY